jgi:DNA-binding transcriptional ArsR family regulator
VTSNFHREVAEQSRTVVTKGLAGFFNSLHHTLRWDGGVLQEGRSEHRNVQADGRGLEIMPSAFWTGPPLIAARPAGLGPHTLILPAHHHWSTTEQSGLSVALGRTRTAALNALAKPCGTGELAQRLDISPASASQHMSVLRASGLVATERRGRSVRHSLTKIGWNILLQNDGEHEPSP